MIVDTSAAVAILRGEPEADAMVAALEGTPLSRMSVASVFELAIVTGASGPDVTDDFLTTFGIRPLPVDTDHLVWCRHALARFGRGSGSPARLNYGDCFAYAAAKVTGGPLLFTGDDFTHTDIAAALAGS